MHFLTLFLAEAFDIVFQSDASLNVMLLASAHARSFYHHHFVVGPLLYVLLSNGVVCVHVSRDSQSQGELWFMQWKGLFFCLLFYSTRQNSCDDCLFFQKSHCLKLVSNFN
jgi:hypothetical protein